MVRFRSLMLLAGIVPTPLAGQLRPTPQSVGITVPAAAPATADSEPRRPGAPSLVFAGVTGMVTGLMAGGLVGVGLAGCPGSGEDDLCGLAAGIYGGMVGMTAGIPVAIHLANHRRGRLGYDLALSGGMLVAGLAFTDATHDATALLFVPVAQIASVIWLETKR